MQMNSMDSLVIKYNADHFFKYMLLGDEDDESIYIRKIIIEEGLHINYLKTKLENPNLIPKNADQKNMYLDALLKDSNKRYIHLEMQRSAMDKEQKARMNAYGMNIIIDQIKAGNEYDNGTIVYQCIFVDDNQIHTTMSETYKKINKNGEEYGVGMVYTTFIYISYIDHLLNHKALDELTSFECILYLFRYGLSCDILKSRKKVVKIMAEKMEEYVSDYAKILERRSIEDYKRHEIWVEKKLKRADELEKENSVLEKENSVLKEDSLILKEENLSLIRARLDEKIRSVQNLMSKYGFTMTAAMDALEISKDERVKIKELVEKVN